MLTENNVTRADVKFPADPVATATVRRYVSDAINKKLPLRSSTLTTTIMSVTRAVYTTSVPTLAVSLAHDRIPVLLVNPEFVLTLDDPENAVVMPLMHEALHLVLLHLGMIDVEKRSDPNYIEAIESWINYYCTQVLQCEMPTSQGKSVGIDPVATFERFKREATKAGLADFPRTIQAFYKNDDEVYKWLSMLPKPPRQKVNFCQHQSDGQPGAGDMSPTLDPNAVGDIVGKALENTLKEASNNKNDKAKDELGRLMDAGAGNETAERVFGDLGAYELLGTTAPEKRTRHWDYWVRRKVGRLVKPGDRLAFNRKRPRDRIFSPKGKVEQKTIVVAIDTSGSMHHNVISQITNIVGRTKAKTRWTWFDGDVWEFKPGDEIRGGGGTNCELVEEWILANCKSYPDAVVVVTDGIFRHFTPRHPDRWVWVITKDGDPWPRDHNPRMHTTVLPFE